MYPDRTLASVTYLRDGVSDAWEPIIKYTGYNNDKRMELGLEFCAGYGHGDYSLGAINYLDSPRSFSPALASMKDVFSIGNILILVGNGDYGIEPVLGKGIRATGYSYHIGKRKRKSYFCLFGVHFSPDLINPIIKSRLAGYEEQKEDLDEIRISGVYYPVLYINRFTGEFYTCSCFDGHPISLPCCKK